MQKNYVEKSYSKSTSFLDLESKCYIYWFCKAKKTFREDLVESTNYHYIQEFLQKLYQGTPKPFILRSLAQNQRVYWFFKVKVIFI